MKIGCCGSPDKAEAIHAAGYDYLEGPLTSLLGDEDDAVFAPVLAQYQAMPLPVPVFNLFLPGDLKVVGPEIDYDRAKIYVKRVIERAQKIGASRLVLGSGRSRNIPDGFPREQAEQQFVDFLNLVADVADDTDVVIVIEPLNRKESNIVNSVAEGAEFAQKVNRPSIKVLADFYHMDEEDEPLANLVDYADWIKHIHVADTGRLAPGTGQYPYAEFAAALKKTGYDGMVSVECTWQDFDKEAPLAAEFLRKTLG